MATGTTILERALRILGVLRQGGTSTTAQKASGLEALNGLLEALSLDRTMVYQVVSENFTWPAATASRTIGSSGNFNTSWPIKLETAYVRDANNVDYPLQITYDRKDWDYYPSKAVQTEIPELLFLDRAYPLATIYLRHVPTAQLTLYISSWKRLQSFAAIGDTVALPPGHEDMLAYNLAERIWPEYPNSEVLPMVTRLALQTRASVRKANPVPMNMQTEIAYAIAQRGRYDINSDT